MRISKYYIFGFSLILLLSFFCYGQEKVRKIEKRSAKNEPIELVGSGVAGKAFNENQILADKDWLKNLKLKLKNISNKTIVYMAVVLRIQKQGKMQYPLELPLAFGQIPQPEFTDTDIANIKGLKPNESVEVSIPSDILEHFTTKFMPENELVDIERGLLYFDFIVFDDGTAWSRGQMMRRNSDNKWQYIRTEQKEVSLFNFILNKPSMSINNWQEKSAAFRSLTNSDFFLPVI